VTSKGVSVGSPWNWSDPVAQPRDSSRLVGHKIDRQDAGTHTLAIFFNSLLRVVENSTIVTPPC